MESYLEAEVSAVFEARRDVAFIRSQWPVVHYVNSNGRISEHTFDFYVRLNSGHGILLAVRPRDKAKSVADILDLMRVQDVITQFADKAMLITDHHIRNGPADNARWILWSRKVRDDNDVEFLRSRTRGLMGTFLFFDLMRDQKWRGTRRSSIWCLIDEGFLVPAEPGRITDLSFLSTAEPQKQRSEGVLS